MDAKTMQLDAQTREFVEDQNSLKSIYGEPTELAAKKSIPKLDQHCRRFIELSPFVCVGTTDADGNADVSPKGDAPGFVEVLDETTLLIPDRLGNNRVDSLRNIIENPHVGLLFMIPGVNETLRVNGRARIVGDQEILDRFPVNGKTPRTVIAVDVDEAFLHCSKAFKRSDLWGETNRVERRTLPTLGKMLADQIGGLDPDDAEEHIQHSLKTRLY